MALEELFLFLLNNSVTAGWVILAVIALRALFRRAPRRTLCLLWALPALRLALPFSIESALSLIPSAETVPQEILTAAAPAINSNIPAVDGAVNPILEASFAPAPEASANPMQVLLFAAGIVYIAGVALIAAYSLYKTIRLRLRLREAVLAEGVWLSDRIDTPFVMGVFRPRIYLPFSLNEGDAACVIAHERAHLARRDNIAKPLGFVLLAVYWFNPLVWLAYVLFCRDLELACDERVIADYDEAGRKAYSAALLACAVHRRDALFCPAAFGEIGVKERIKRVLSFKKPAVWISAASAAAVAIAAVCLLTNPVSAAAETDYDTAELESAAAAAEAALTQLDDGADMGEVIASANRELSQWYRLGIINHALQFPDDGQIGVSYNEGGTQNSDDTRVWKPGYVVHGAVDGEYYVNLYLEKESGKIYFASIEKTAAEGDEPLADREPMEGVSGDGETTLYYYYDNFSDIMAEDMTVEELCKLLNDYWGFDGYTLCGTKYDDYGYDSEPPEADALVKDFIDEPWITVSFRGDKEGAYMYISPLLFPGSTHMSIGITHMVG